MAEIRKLREENSELKSMILS